MAEELIEHERNRLSVYNFYIGDQYQLDTFVMKGLKCECLGLKHNDYRATITWNFDWTKLEIGDVDTLSGSIQVNQDNYSETIDVELNEKVQAVSKDLSFNHSSPFSYKVTVIAIRFNRDVIYDELFLPSSKHDAILIVEEKKLHVNKANTVHSTAHTGYHSEFFEALFSSKFKEGEMDEIEIKDVSFDDFGLLMSTIYPDSTFPTDRNTEKLLEMADRFMIRSVIARVEYHLLHNSKIGISKMTWMADKYQMRNLIKKVLLLINSIAVAKQIKGSQQYKELSDQMKAKILDRILELKIFL